MAHRGQADETAADELLIYLDNEEDLYRQKQAIAKNLLTKMARKTYEHSRAPDAWSYVVENAAKKYAKEFATRASEWSSIFSVPTREIVAKELADRWLANAKNGRPDEV